ncbi:dihydrolipoamide acetyltransferase component [Stagonosporopsis vannaccii]|nr:dihydrolipoamide acetyltransferase component [Stagonosporopsis vannaccii]
MPATAILSRAGAQLSSRAPVALRAAVQRCVLPRAGGRRAPPRASCPRRAACTASSTAPQLTRPDARPPSPPSPATMPVSAPRRTSAPARPLTHFSAAYPSHTVISMPALSPTMTAGNIGAWQKKVGDSIAPGDVLVEIETDKAQMDFEFQEEGTIAKILRDAGEKDVAVGSPIAVMVEEGEDVSAFDKFTIEDAGGDKKPDTPAKEGNAAEASEPADSGSKTAPPQQDAAPVAQESDSTGNRLETSLQRQPAYSPAVKKLALEKGIALKNIKGTGRGGAVTKEDVEKAKPAAAAAPAAAGASAAAYEDVEASSMRKVIASRLTESMQQNPHYFVASTISVSKLLKLREALNASADGAYKLSVNDLLVKALAVAARKVPAANSSWREIDGKVIIRQHNVVDVSVAVSTPVGLMTPIVKNVNGLGLSAISSQIKDLGKRARDGKLKPEEYQGGSITISNMGMNAAVERFTAVINPPQACIVAIGTTKKVAVPGDLSDDGTPTVSWDDQIVITGSFDHKVVDGAVGGDFMKELKRAIENPLELLL